MDQDRLAAMANQIAAFFRSYPREEAIEGVAAHIRQFWDPRMRGRLQKRAVESTEGLDPLVVEAVRRLSEPVG
jgi:formate dehydrogenase subunit delta